MKTHWLDQFERDQDARFVEYRVYTPPKNPLECLSTDQLIEKIACCLDAKTRPVLNEILRRLKS